MSADPRKIYREASESKRNMLRQIWPELHDAIAPAAGPAGVVRELYCVLGSCPMTDPRPVAVGRLTRNGHPACRAHIAKAADRPGGWPLERQEGPPS